MLFCMWEDNKQYVHLQKIAKEGIENSKKIKKSKAKEKGRRYLL